MPGFGLDDLRLCHAVKAAVAAHQKIPDAVLNDMPLYGLSQRGADVLRRVVVARKTADFNHDPQVGPHSMR